MPFVMHMFLHLTSLVRSLFPSSTIIQGLLLLLLWVMANTNVPAILGIGLLLFVCRSLWSSKQGQVSSRVWLDILGVFISDTIKVHPLVLSQNLRTVHFEFVLSPRPDK
jgi:hypothetical protein